LRVLHLLKKQEAQRCSLPAPLPFPRYPPRRRRYWPPLFERALNPHANRLTVHILAAVAEHERGAISERTKAALAAAKRRGIKLGGPRLAAARKASIKARSEAADAFAANVRPIIKEIQASGVSSLRGVARALTARGVRTARGGDWTAVQVSDILRR
jgi:Resolvase, N terminal domain/Recombinase